MIMLALSLIKWWYFEGWKTFFRLLMQKISDRADYFSFGTIFKTFFSPFRQIDTGEATTPGLSGRFSAWLGRLISRIIGAIVRFFIAIAGLLIIFFEFIFGLFIGIIWPFIPLFPVVFVILACSGLTFGVNL